MKRTDSYIGTFNNDIAGLARVADLRKFVTYMNKMLKEDGFSHRFYVKLQGRLGKDNPNAWKYRQGCGWSKGGYGGCQSVRLPDAAHADAYIYKRNPY